MQSGWDDSFGTLIIHFIHRFFDTDMPSEESVPRTRLIQLLALLAVVSPLLMLLVIRAVQGLRLGDAGFDVPWLRVTAHFTFVCYAMAVTGLVMVFSWDALFPDKRDYLILGSLPVSAKRLFAAKAIGMAAILVLFVIATNAVLCVFVAFLDPGALVGHIVGVFGASIFVVLFLAALQGLLINVLPGRLFQRISPSLQMVVITLLLTMILIMPLIALVLRPLLLIHSGLLDYFPPVWFLGLYESLSFPAGPLANAGVWAAEAVKMIAVVLMATVGAYAIGYRRHARKVLESVDSSDVTPGPLKRLEGKVLHGLLQTNAYQRAAFDFIQKVSSRSARHRVSSALYFGLGLALALSSLFVIDVREAFPLRLSISGLLEAPASISFLIVAGWRSTFGIPHELPANWIFQMTSKAGAADFRKAIRKWLFACRIVPVYVLIAGVEFYVFAPAVAAIHLTVDLITTAFLIEVFFFAFRKVPFTCTYLRNKLQLAFYAVAYLAAYTSYTTLMGDLKRWTVADPQHLLRFIAVSTIGLGGTLIYRAMSGAEKGKFLYEEPDSRYESLNLM
jgi:hypothetical protein